MWDIDGSRRAALIERNRSPKQRAAVSVSKRGKPVILWTDEQRDKVRRKLLGRKYSEETRHKMSIVRKGKPLSDKNRISLKIAHNSPEVRAKHSHARKMHAQLKLYGICRCRIHNWKYGLDKANQALKQRGSLPTGIEKLLVGVILSEFPEVVEQKEFFPYTVDAYLPPPYHLAFEADGTYYHRYPKKDAARDAHLLRKYSLPVIRLTENHINEVCRGKSPDGDY